MTGGPLEGVRVIDFSRLLPGPYATMMLGELGADVIKVEQPGIGDPSRHNNPRYRHGSVYFHAANGNKRSIALDMAAEPGKEVAQRLLRWADVAVESFRPGVAARARGGPVPGSETRESTKTPQRGSWPE